MPTAVKYNKGFRVNFTYKGNRKRKDFSFANFKDPEKAAENYISLILSGEKPEKGSPTLGEMIDKYMDWSIHIKRKAATTIRRDQQRLSRFAEWMSRKQKITKIAKNDMREFQEYFFANAPFVQKPYHRRQFNSNPQSNWEKYRQNLHAFFKWCIDRNHLDTNPIDGQEFKFTLQERLPARIFTKEELDKIFDYFDNFGSPQLSVFFRFLAYTGMRPGEAIRLEQKNIDLKNSVIKLTKTKTKKIRSAMISKKLKPYLKNIPKGKYLFDSGNGGHLYTESWYWRLLRRATDELRIPPARLYDFRHTFAASLAQRGVPLATLSELMGHSDIKSTLIYIHFYPQHLKKAIDSLPY